MLVSNNKIKLILLLKVINILSFNTKILKFMIYLTIIKNSNYKKIFIINQKK